MNLNDEFNKVTSAANLMGFIQGQVRMADDLNKWDRLDVPKALAKHWKQELIEAEAIKNTNTILNNTYRPFAYWHTTNTGSI